MSEPIKLTEEELTKIKGLRQRYQQKIYTLGQIQIERFGLLEDKRLIENSLDRLTTSENSIKKEYLDIQSEEETLLVIIKNKYGEGSINVTDGSFTPKDSIQK